MTMAPAAVQCSVRARKAPRKARRPYRGPAQSVWWFILPAAALYAFAVVVPSVQGGLFAFTDWDGVSPTTEWVGLKQFKLMLNDPYARTAITNTLLIAVAVPIIQNVLGLLVALGVNSRIKSRKVLRVVFFAPVVITSIAVGFLWQNLFSPKGAINQILEALGLDALTQNWLGDPDVAIWAIVIVVIWQYVGYSMVIFLTGLQRIPDEVIEASDRACAVPIRRFWYITRPLLAPAITINLMLSLIGGFKLFDQVFVMTEGGPGGATETISTLIYTNAFQLGRFAYGAALAVVLTLFVAVASAIQYRLLSKQES